MPGPARTSFSLRFTFLTVFLLVFSNSSLCQEVPWAQNPNNPNNVIGNILAATNHYADRNNVQQPVGVAPPNSFSQPTPGQTQAFINQNPVLRNLDPMTKQSLVMGGQYGVPVTNVLNSPYINGQPNPFYQNGQAVPNWYLPTTWTSNSMSWQGVQPNGFLPSGSATTHISTFSSSVYNPTNYTPTYSAPRYQPQMVSTPNRDTTRTTNLNPIQSQIAATNSRFTPPLARDAGSLASVQPRANAGSEQFRGRQARTDGQSYRLSTTVYQTRKLYAGSSPNRRRRTDGQYCDGSSYPSGSSSHKICRAYAGRRV